MPTTDWPLEPTAPDQETFEELASMFLTNADSSAPGSAGAAARDSRLETPGFAHRPLVEVLLIGHLPVRAGLWLTPYTDALARRLGRAALLRLDRENPCLEVLRGPGMDAASMSLPDLIDRAAPDVDAWVIRPPENSDHRELLQSRPDRITILTGGDGAAVVAAYQLIRSLAETAEAAGIRLPAIGLAVAGIDERRAQDVAERVSRTVGAFLDRRIDLVLALPQMDGAVRCTLHQRYDRQSCPGVAQALQWIRTSIRSGGNRGRVPAGRPAGAIEPPAPEGRSAPEVKLKPQPGAASEGAKGDKSTGQQVNRPTRLPSALSACPAVNLSLAAHVAGLRAIEPRCPDREHIEMAVDEAGDLHLLGRDSMLRDLVAVRDWARRHWPLLRLAEPTLGGAVGREPTAESREPAITCHLFTAEPASVCDLHGSGLRLHVLAPVAVGDQTGWYAAPLNR